MVIQETRDHSQADEDLKTGALQLLPYAMAGRSSVVWLNHSRPGVGMCKTLDNGLRHGRPLTA